MFMEMYNRSSSSTEQDSNVVVSVMIKAFLTYQDIFDTLCTEGNLIKSMIGSNRQDFRQRRLL